jgi:hypothetical protein
MEGIPGSKDRDCIKMVPAPVSRKDTLRRRVGSPNDFLRIEEG